jgi:oligopeptide/dipeptide ABC transporter ATP-binding protein
MTNPLLSVDDLHITFRAARGDVRAVDGISFAIGAGKTMGLVGESGCGKSATALSILRLIPKQAGGISGGSIRFRDRDLTTVAEADMRQVRGNEISMIFQEPMTSLNPVFTIGYQLIEAIRHHRRISKRDAKREAEEMLALVQIPASRMTEYPHRLSGGMRQRVMIAMALSCSPALLIADEPTTALDVTVQAQILELMADLQRQLGMALLLITHDLGIVAEQADEVAVMYAGRIVERALPERLFAAPAHPYTTGLLASIPGASADGKLHAIPGSVPSAFDLPSGCRFRNRCPRAEAVCAEREPVLAEIAENHWAACHFAGA